MPFTSDAERLTQTKPRQAPRMAHVPVIPGTAKPAPGGTAKTAPPATIHTPPEVAQIPADAPEKPTRRMWLAAGAVAVVSSVSLVWAFAQRDGGTPPPDPACKIVAVSEPAKNIVDVRLAHSAGHEKVWVGNDTGVMEAHAAAAPDTYRLDTAGYLHHDLIGVYVGGTFCDNRFNLGSVQPGDEQFFAP